MTHSLSRNKETRIKYWVKHIKKKKEKIMGRGGTDKRNSWICKHIRKVELKIQRINEKLISFYT